MTELLSEYPRIVEVLQQGKREHPEIFPDWKEVQFKALVEEFANKYEPEMKGHLTKLFFS